MCSLHPEVGITVGDREEAYVKQAMIGASTEVVGLISLGTMGTSLPYLVGPASRLTRLITAASDEDVLNPSDSEACMVAVSQPKPFARSSFPPFPANSDHPRPCLEAFSSFKSFTRL